MGPKIIGDKYNILECLYRSANNQVYLVQHNVLGNKRVVKQMKKEGNFQLAEVEILKRLSHPNIPTIIDVLEDEENIYMVRDFAAGNNLEEILLERKSFSEEELRQIAMQLADVLHYLHTGCDVPVIYRDLKPENIILDSQNRLYLIDFGIARFSETTKQTDTVFLGTKAYAAPEQFGFLKSDEKTDIYAYGMTLYYLLGKHKITDYPYKRLEAKTWLKDYTEDLVQLIYECSEPQREKRPEDFGEIKKRLAVYQSSASSKLIFPNNTKIYMGIRRGVGTSYITYANALAAQRQGQKVAILDWSEGRQIEKMGYFSTKVEMKKHSFTLEGVEVFPLKHRKSLPVNIHEFDAVFVDYGVFNRDKKNELKDRRENIWLVSAGAEWDIGELDEIIFEENLMEYQFILNLAEQEIFQTLLEDYPQIAWTDFPYRKEIWTEPVNEVSQPENKTTSLLQQFSQKLPWNERKGEK